ncbi:MAG: pyridoxamine 5'-phosphate oxidase [Bacteroidota bacterium]|nr:pyridoxamine 5'-phosphate oxidase [Bacteroidota bacterium]
MTDLTHFRKVYNKGELLENNIPEDPINLFHRWFHEVEALESSEETNAMNVSTIGTDGFPKTRVVLLKKFNEEGFIFFTNYLSEKGKAIAENPNVCLSFFWHCAERQVIIKGIAEQTDSLTSDNYFDSRPLGSKLGAIASPQSQIIENRTILEEKLKHLESLPDENIKRPKYWGGFLVRPISIEFWQGRPNRLHDRIRYTLEKDYSWKIERLAP